MTDMSTPLPSRRAQREAREAAERLATETGNPSQTPSPNAVVTSATDELPSRRSLRRALEPTSETPSATDRDTDRDQWVVTTSNVGTNNTAVPTLHIEKFPSGEIAGPIDHTGEIILTGPISIPTVAVESAPAPVVVASAGIDAPGIPRRATEALSIIGRAAPINENKRTSTVGQGISAGFATFLGLLVLALIGVAIYTDLI